MKIALRPNAYYVAGLISKGREEHNAVGIKTGIRELEERFIEIAVKDFRIDPKRILVEPEGNCNHVYFYHSQVSKQLRAIIKQEARIFIKRDAKSASYIAGIFDAAGHAGRDSFRIKGLTPAEAYILESCGIHTHGDMVLNIGSFIGLVKGRSIIIERSALS